MVVVSAPFSELPPSSLIVQDSRFSPTEGKLASHCIREAGLTGESLESLRFSPQTSTERIHRRIEHGQTRRDWTTSERILLRGLQPRIHEIAWWKAGLRAWRRLETCSQCNQATAPKKQGENSPRRPPFRPVADNLQTIRAPHQTNLRLLAYASATGRIRGMLARCEVVRSSPRRRWASKRQIAF